MKKILLIFVMCALLSCSQFFTGEKQVDPKTGETTYGESPFEGIATIVGSLLGFGTITGAVARMGVRAARARDALMDANQKAIDEADWSEINSKESFKILLKTAQNSHKDSSLIRDYYVAWKEKKKI